MKKQKTENLKHKIPSENKGITLIALVITIIVMLILVGVTISMAVNGGLFNYAQKAVGETKNAIEKEQQLAGGGLNIAGTWYNSIDEYVKTEEGGEVNFEELFKTATKHPDQTESDDIGIAEDGTIVNLDLWHYILTCYIGDKKEYQLGEDLGSSGVIPGYKNENITGEGTIQGKVPMYIKEVEEASFYPVTRSVRTFANCRDLITAPELPSSLTYEYATFSDCSSLTLPPTIPVGITELNDTFANCSSLTIAPAIPEGVTELNSTFTRCSSLTIAPILPSSVTDISGAFIGCSKLTTAPEIPSSVTDMVRTFEDCSSLTGTLKINANPSDYHQCFDSAATNEGCALVLEGPNQEVLNNLLTTKSANSNITIKQ